jgi:type VI secretion system protein ImpC
MWRSFIGAQSLHKPAEYCDADAADNANLCARLPYMFPCCRFAHYLLCIERDGLGLGADQTRRDIERRLLFRGKESSQALGRRRGSSGG